MVTLLNRLGHGLSYSQIEQLETSIANKQLSQQEDGVFLPSVIQPGVFATFCWDNIDLLEETLSGANTTHCTNGIVVQCKLDTYQNIHLEAEKTPTSKKRSLKSSVSYTLVPCHSGNQALPPM